MSGDFFSLYLEKVYSYFMTYSFFYDASCNVISIAHYIIFLFSSNMWIYLVRWISAMYKKYQLTLTVSSRNLNFFKQKIVLFLCKCQSHRGSFEAYYLKKYIILMFWDWNDILHGEEMYIYNFISFNWNFVEFDLGN